MIWDGEWWIGDRLSGEFERAVQPVEAITANRTSDSLLTEQLIHSRCDN